MQAVPAPVAFCNRAVGGRAYRAQYGCCRRNVGISAAIPIGGEALLVSDPREQAYRWRINLVASG